MTVALFSMSALAAEPEALTAKVRRSVVAVRSRAGGGSGTAWRADGLVVTNNHVVPGDSAVVVLADGREFPARLTARDPDRDLATLRIDAVLEPIEAALGERLSVRWKPRASLSEPRRAAAHRA